MRRFLFVFVLTAVVAYGLGPASVMAQQAQPAQQHKTPMLSDGHPDLTGIWLNAAPRGAGAGFGRQYPDGSKIFAAFTAPADSEDKDPTGASVFDTAGRVARQQAARAKVDPNAPNIVSYKPDWAEKAKTIGSDAVHNDPAFRCGQDGLPRIGPPIHIYSIPGRVVFVYTGYHNIIREIATDNRPHDTANQDTNYGDSVGHWEGNTLVVDSVGFNDKTWLGGGGGNIHSNKMHVVERLTRVGDALKYEVTVDDPVAFTRPWVPNPRNLKAVAKDDSGFDALEEAAQCDEREQEHMHFGDI